MELISDYLKAFTFPLETHEYDPGIAVFFLDRDFSDVAGSCMQLDEKWVIFLLKWSSLEPWTYMIICEYKFFILQVLSSIWTITEDLSEFVTTYCFLTIHPRRGEGPIGKLCLPGEGGIRDLFSEILPVILQSFNFQNWGGGTSNPLYSSSHQPSLYTSYISAYYYILKYTNVLKVKS